MKLIFTFLLLNLSFTLVSATEFKGKFTQGSFILGLTEPGSEVTIDERKIRVSKNGYFAFGLDRDRKNNVLIIIKKNGKIKKILLKYPNKLNSIFIPKKYYYKFECISKKKINHCQYY